MERIPHSPSSLILLLFHQPLKLINDYRCKTLQSLFPTIMAWGNNDKERCTHPGMVAGGKQQPWMDGPSGWDAISSWIFMRHKYWYSSPMTRSIYDDSVLFVVGQCHTTNKVLSWQFSLGRVVQPENDASSWCAFTLLSSLSSHGARITKKWYAHRWGSIWMQDFVSLYSCRTNVVNGISTGRYQELFQHSGINNNSCPPVAHDAISPCRSGWSY